MSARGRGRGRRKAGRAATSLAPRDLRVRPPALAECFAQRASEVLDRLQKRDTLSIFLQPVDNEIAPEYDVIVKNKMDFSTMRGNVARGGYGGEVDAFHADLSLIWSNCLLYNGAGMDNVFSKKAVELRKITDGKLIPAMATALDADKKCLDQWMERHRRRPAASPPGGPFGDGGGTSLEALGMGESAADGGGGAEAGDGDSERVVVDEDAEAAARAAARAVKSELNSAAAIAAANEAAAKAARKAALREQYGVDGDGLWRALEDDGEKERVWFVGVDRPAFRASDVRYDPGRLVAEEDEGLGGPEGRVDACGLERAEGLLTVQRGEGERVRPVHQVSAGVYVPRRGGYDVDAAPLAARGLGPPPRLNPCRPQTGVESVKVKDYVQSLQAFIAGAGLIATKIIGELLSPEIAVLREEEVRKKKRREAAAKAEKEADGEGAGEDGRKRGASLLPKLSKRIDELDGEDGLERIVGVALANEVRAVPLEEINFTMPYGLNPGDMDAITQFALSEQASQPALSFLLQLKNETDLQARRQAAGAQRIAPGGHVSPAAAARNHFQPQDVKPEQQQHALPVRQRLSPGGREASPYRGHESPHHQPQQQQSQGRFLPGRSPSASSLMRPMSSPAQHMQGRPPQRGMDGGAPLRALELEAQAQAQAASQAIVEARQAREAASLAATAESRAREVELASRRLQARNSAIYAYSTSASATIPGASPIGAMHDAAMLNTAVPQPIADRIKELSESYRERAKDAAGMAAQAARALSMNGGVDPSGGSLAGFSIGGGLSTGHRETSSTGSGGRGSAASSLQHLPPADENATCDHCNTKDTPGWRQGPSQGQRLCNACGLYFVKHKQMRPPDLWSKKRSSPSNSKNGGGSASKAPRFSLHGGAPGRNGSSSKMKTHGGSSGSSPHGAVCAAPSHDRHLLMDRHAGVDGGGPDQLSRSSPDDHLAQASTPGPSLSIPGVRAGSAMQPHIPSMTDLLVPKNQQCAGERNEPSDSVALLPPTMPPDLQAPIDFRDAGVSNPLCGMDDGTGLGRAPSPGLPMFMSNPRMEISRNGDRKLDDSQMRGMNVSELVAPSTGNGLDGPLLDRPSSLLDVSPSRTSPRGDDNGLEGEQAGEQMVQSLFGLPDSVPDDEPDFGF